MKNDNDKIKKEKQDEKEEKPKNESEQEIEKLKQKVEECENSYKRALADYQNLQKRGIEERQNWLKIANRELLLRLLPVLDTLMLAYKHKESDELRVSINQFIDVLKAEEITRIDTIDKIFDPLYMEAVGIAEGEEGKVMDEIRAGFMIYDKLLRPSQVKVGKRKEESIKE
ncbi:nucleotide exchange factor GrpE [Patescibacteria group bacterium]|nr:nucleotide exchange factor GrpE [Patescibacteria group bacterium]